MLSDDVIIDGAIRASKVFSIQDIGFMFAISICMVGIFYYLIENKEFF